MAKPPTGRTDKSPVNLAAVRAARSKAKPVRPTVAAVPADRFPEALPWPDGCWAPDDYFMQTDGLYRKGGGGNFRVCGPLEILAESRPEDGSDWGVLVSFRDRDNTAHTWIMPRRLLVGEAMDVRARLASHGLHVGASQGARQALVQFLTDVRSSRRLRTVPRTGWYVPAKGDRVFVLPDSSADLNETTSGEIVRLDLDPPPAVYGRTGTLEDWQRRVAALCIGNSRLIFGVACAFAPILLPLVGDEGGGINLRGESSKGKTTVIDAAASVWGPPSKTGPGSYVRQWRTTSNALEATAAAHNHALLPMDELGQVDPKELGDTLYMLANGAGKDRARAGGGNRAATTWLTLVLSSSEESSASLMAQAGRRSKAGLEIRLLDVPALVPGGHGCFEELHGAADGAAFSRVVRQGAVAQHGTAAPAFLAWLTEKLRENADFAAVDVRNDVRDWVAHFVPPGADGQVQRAAYRLGLIAIAGELATEAKVTGWATGTAWSALGQVFRTWVAERGGTGNREDHHLFAAVRAFLGAHGSARFEAVREPDPQAQAEPTPDARDKTILRAGWRWQETLPVSPGGAAEDGTLTGQIVWVYGMIPEVFTAEIAGRLGMEARDALGRLAAVGLIRSDVEGGVRRWTIKKKRIPGHGRPRLVVFNQAVFDAEDGL